MIWYLGAVLFSTKCLLGHSFNDVICVRFQVRVQTEVSLS
jgi:hypothetical protein